MRQSDTELDRVKTDLDKQSAERTRLETEWREQLNAAKTAAAQTEAMLAEKTARYSQLETELAGLQQTRAEWQNKFAVEQEKVVKSQQEINQLQERLRQGGTELERAKAGWEQESAKRAQLESECQNLAQARESLNLELNDLRQSQAAHETKLRDKQRKLAEGLRENIQLLQLRLQEAESFNGDAEAMANVKL